MKFLGAIQPLIEITYYDGTKDCKALDRFCCIGSCSGTDDAIIKLKEAYKKHYPANIYLFDDVDSDFMIAVFIYEKEFTELIDKAEDNHTTSFLIEVKNNAVEIE